MNKCKNCRRWDELTQVCEDIQYLDSPNTKMEGASAGIFYVEAHRPAVLKTGPDFGCTDYEPLSDWLCREAIADAEERGHLMEEFEFIEELGAYYSHCTKCGMQAMVVLDPDPNGIAISGAAVAVNCHAREDSKCQLR